MPLPLIPAAILAASAAAAVKGAFDTVTGVSTILQAQERYERNRTRYEAAETAHRQQRATVEAAIIELGRARLRAMQTLGFVVDFLRRAALTTTPVTDEFEITEEILEQWEGVSVEATDALRGVATSAGAGIAMAAGVQALVAAFGTASTGTAIASLGGAAASSATLAWLGGGALAVGGGGMALGSVVLGGLIAGPAVLVAGFFVGTHAEQVRTEVARHIAAMEVAKAEMRRREAEFVVWNERARELQLGLLRLASHLEDTLNTADVTSEEDVFTVFRMAKSLAELIKLPALAAQP